MKGASSALCLASAAGLALLLTGCGGGDSAPAATPASAPVPVVPVSVDDPLYPDQWHLHNSGRGQSSSGRLLLGEDVNVEPVWSGGIKGSGVLLVVVDDGLEIAHEDLVANVAAGKSWDYQQHDTDPTPSLLLPTPTVPSPPSHAHGTKVAGIAAARDLNGVGGRGVAPRVSLAGYNLLWDDAGTVTSDMGDAMMRDVDVAISSNSWGLGVDGDGVTEHPLNSFWHDGIASGIANGRGGKGTIYVWAGGNGGEFGVDNSNYDYLANNRHVMAVCAVDGDGVRTPYSEPGANLWLCAPGGYYDGLTTTDLMEGRGDNRFGTIGDYGNRSYTRLFAGTSAATPIVSGVVALMLEANPDLGWRDVRLILAETARQNDAGDSGWGVTIPAPNQPPYHINHNYGFGVVDAAAAVARAKSWTNVGAQLQRVFSLNSAIAIPDNDLNGVEQSVVVDQPNDLIIEYVEIDVNIVHGDPGDLKIVLTAPSTTQSTLAESHTCAVTTATVTTHVCPANNYAPWTFGSSRHLGESSKGEWKLKIIDQRPNNTGSLISWKLHLYGRQP